MAFADWSEEACKRRRVEIRTPEPQNYAHSEDAAALQNPHGPTSLEGEPPLEVGNERFEIDIDSIELDFCTPNFDHHFNTNLLSCSNALKPTETNNTFDSLSPFFAAQDTICEPSLDEQVALHTRAAVSPFTTQNTLQVSSQTLSITHRLGEPFTSLWSLSGTKHLD